MTVCIQQVQSGSDILLGSTGSFKRFESVDRQSAYDGELVAAMLTPPWATDETIPPQPLRPAPLPLATKFKTTNNHSTKNASNHGAINIKQTSLELNKPLTSAPLIKSLPRPTPRKQLSAPAASNCQIPLINPPSNSNNNIEKTKDKNAIINNPFLNGLVNFESIKSNFFSMSIQETSICKIENERATKSAMPPLESNSKNPFKNLSENNVFDFNPNTIKSIMEEAPDDDGYEGDNDDIEDPLKQLEVRIQKLEASNKQRRRSESQSPSRFSPKMLNKASVLSPTSSSSSPVGGGAAGEGSWNGGSELNLNVNEKFVASSLNLEGTIGVYAGGNGCMGYRKHLRNRSYSENEVCCELESVYEQEVVQCSPVVTMASTNPFQTSPTSTTTNSKRPLLKTPSETYLEQYSLMKSNGPISTSIVVNNKTIQLCKHPSLTKIIQSSPQSLKYDTTIMPALNDTALKRTISSESISSDSSVVISSLERSAPPVTGNLCIALQYDK